jgi:hypothetical protein
MLLLEQIRQIFPPIPHCYLPKLFADAYCCSEVKHSHGFRGILIENLQPRIPTVANQGSGKQKGWPMGLEIGKYKK